jgi:hypothetical protein
MAITASEKDIENVRDYNAKLAATQQKADAAVLKAGKGQQDKGFGTGLEGVAQTLLADYAPDYAAGTLDPKLTRRFESALKIVTQPVPYTNAETGLIEYRTPELPRYITEAVASRELLKGGTLPQTQATWTGTELPPAELAQLQSAAKTGNVEAKKVLEAYERRSPAGTSSSNVDKGPTGISLFELTPLVTGPEASFKASISSIPGLGGSFADVTQARAYDETAINGVVAALRTTDRFGNMEREEIKKNLNLTPTFMQDPNKRENVLVGLASFIEQQREEAQRVIDNKSLNVKLRIEASALLQDMDKALRIINPPPKLYSLEEVANLPVGAKFRWNGTELKTRKPNKKR